MSLRILPPLLIGLLTGISAHADCSQQGKTLPYQPLADKNMEILFTPPGKNRKQGHARWIQQIGRCGNYLQMEMFHLTDPNVIAALKLAAKKIRVAHPGAADNDLKVGVRVILDNGFYNDAKNKPIIDDLTQAGVLVRPSSPSFTITHAKTLNCDGKTVFITAMNMTKNELSTRDFGIVTKDPGVLTEHEFVFSSDWNNYRRTKDQGVLKLQLNDKNALLWSPQNSKEKMLALIQSAQPGKTIACSTESLTDTDVRDALVAASQCNVDVRFLAPQCDENPCPLLNLPAIFKMNTDAKKVIARVMPGTGSPQTPYIHSKMCVVNFDAKTGTGGTVFVGSENSSANSLEHAREEGIVVRNDLASKTIVKFFNSDWKQAVLPTDPNNCPQPKAALGESPECEPAPTSPPSSAAGATE